MTALPSVEKALAEIKRAAHALPPETVSIDKAAGRVLAADVVAAITQPPFRASAMDGYAIRTRDAEPGVRLRVIGVSAAGSPFRGAVGALDAVRIFTGAVAPEGADRILIQEEARVETDSVVVTAPQTGGTNIREAGIDFSAGAVLKRRGARLSAIDLGLIASSNVSDVSVSRRPLVAYFDNGDELVEPGSSLEVGRIVGSNRFALEALIAEWGGTPRYLGRAADDPADVRRKFAEAAGADLIIAVGGASVGDHDYVRRAFAEAGGEIGFSKISVKPGKPTWFGRLGKACVIGLPGNPASAIVCAVLFVEPLIAGLLGESSRGEPIRASLSAPAKANGARESYLRGRVVADPSGRLVVTPFVNEDSSLMTPLASGNCLVRRMANAPAAAEGDIIDCILYGAIATGGAE
jgi:molybdopterin molybdotransferase